MTNHIITNHLQTNKNGWQNTLQQQQVLLINTLQKHLLTVAGNW